MGRVGNLVEVPYKELPEEYKKYITVNYDSEGKLACISSTFNVLKIKWIDEKLHFLIPSERIPFWKLKEYGGYL